MTSDAAQAAEGLVNSLVAAWNAHDARAFARCFAEDANFTNVFGMHAKGRAAIETFHAPIFATMFKDSRLAATQTRSRALRADIVAFDVRWEMTGARGPDGASWPLRRGLMNMVAVREGSAWSIAVMHNMDLPSEEMAEAQAKLQRSVR
jgi:uncharacterized protein (TIGR02246 family)